MFESFPLWPQRASSIAGEVDALYVFLLLLSAFMTVAIFTMILVFAVRYRRRPGVRAEQIEGSHKLEITWSIVPLGVFMVIFLWSAIIFFKQRTPPEGAGTVYVVAKQWMWKLQHEEGQREINQLHIPVGKDVKLIMTSQDVIHSFYVPAFRIKQDVLPGRYTTAWFRATKAGDLSPVLRGILRHAAFGNGWIGCGDGTGGVSGLVERRGCDPIVGADWRSDVPAAWMLDLPSYGYARARSELDRTFMDRK